MKKLLLIGALALCFITQAMESPAIEDVRYLFTDEVTKSDAALKDIRYLFSPFDENRAFKNWMIQKFIEALPERAQIICRGTKSLPPKPFNLFVVHQMYKEAMGLPLHEDSLTTLSLYTTLLISSDATDIIQIAADKLYNIFSRLINTTAITDEKKKYQIRETAALYLPQPKTPPQPNVKKPIKQHSRLF